MQPLLAWAIEEFERPSTAPLELLVALLGGIWRVPGAWLVLKDIAGDLAAADPAGYLAGLSLLAACFWLVTGRGRAALGAPRLLLGPRLASAAPKRDAR